jgi:hypothetical protein
MSARRNNPVGGVAAPRLVRLLGSRLSRMLDSLPNQSKEYPGWKSWLIVARLKTMATWMNASGSISDSWRMAVKSYPINSLQCLPYRHRNPHWCRGYTSSNASRHQASEAQCPEESRTDKGCIPSGQQSVTPRSQPLAPHLQAQSLTLPSVGSQEVSPSLPSQAQVRSSLSRTPSQDPCSPCDDVVGGGVFNSLPNLLFTYGSGGKNPAAL